MRDALCWGIGKFSVVDQFESWPLLSRLRKFKMTHYQILEAIAEEC